MKQMAAQRSVVNSLLIGADPLSIGAHPQREAVPGCAGILENSKAFLDFSQGFAGTDSGLIGPNSVLVGPDP